MTSHKYSVDVLVVGGGVAGVSAALSAARNGLRTLLLESQTSLGGLATNGLVNGIAGMVDGNCKEWLERLNAMGALYDRPHLPVLDPDKGKLALESMLLEAGARLLYGAYVIDTAVQDGRITEVICHTKSGPMAISAGIVIDATGDADVATFAGVPYEVGGSDFAGFNMSTTMVFKMANVDMRGFTTAADEWMARETAGNKVASKMALIEELEEKAVQAGDLPFFIFPNALLYRTPGTPEDDAEVTVNVAHSYNCRNLDVEDYTRQIIEQHQQILWLEKFFKKYVPGFGRARLSGIANMHGTRDSRRIVGEYMLSDEDVVCSRKFEDGITRSPEFLDTHHPTSPRLGFMRHVHLLEPKAPAVCRPADCSCDMHPFVQPGGYEARVNPHAYCEIPYRSLIPLTIDNLLVVGRCISTQFHASSAARVIAPAMGTGQAGALAAALCLEQGVIPRRLDGKLVRKAMIEQGVPLDQEPDGYWSDIRGFEGEHVVIPGDFAGIITKDGIKVRMGE